MRECGIGHHDHVHIDMTDDGASGNVSYWGRTPRTPAPKFDTQALFDFGSSGAKQSRGTTCSKPTRREWPYRPAMTVLLSAIGTETVSNPRCSCGTSTPAPVSSRSGTTATRSTPDGPAHPLWDDVVAGDFDNDGAVDDMIFWDRQTGTWVAHSWYRFVTTRRGRPAPTGPHTTTSSRGTSTVTGRSTTSYVGSRRRVLAAAELAPFPHDLQTADLVDWLRPTDRRRLECRRRHGRGHPGNSSYR